MLSSSLLVRRTIFQAGIRHAPADNQASNQLRTFAASAFAQDEDRARNTVRDADRQLSRAAKMAKLSGMSMVRQEQPLQDITVLPPLRQIGLTSVNQPYQYIKKRVKRGFYTVRSIAAIVTKDPYSAKQTKDKIKRFYESFFAAFWPQASASALRSHLRNVWETYNKAIASGDLNALKSTSKSTAFEYARNRAAAAGQNQGGATIEWNVAKHLSMPRIVHARHWEVDQNKTEIAQVVVRFSTEQTLTIHQRNKAPSSRSTQMTEYVVFERFLSDPLSRWQVRDKVTPFTGGDVPQTLIG